MQPCIKGDYSPLAKTTAIFLIRGHLIRGELDPNQNGTQV